MVKKQPKKKTKIRRKQTVSFTFLWRLKTHQRALLMRNKVYKSLQGAIFPTSSSPPPLPHSLSPTPPPLLAQSCSSLTYDHRQDNQDDDDQDDPQLHVLPPQLPLPTGSRALEDVGILVLVFWRERGGEGSIQYAFYLSISSMLHVE